MILDIITILLLLLPMLYYRHKGFARSVFGMIAWIASLVLGFLFSDDLRDLFMATPWGKSLVTSIQELFPGALEDSTAYQNSPEFLQKMLVNWNTETTEVAAEFANYIALIGAFLVIILGIKIIFSILMLLFSKDHHRDDVIGSTDQFAGTILGIIIGILLISLFYGFLTYRLDLLSPEHALAVRQELDGSLFSHYIYDFNPLLQIFNYLQELL